MLSSEHRVFRIGEEWWAAYAQNAGGGGWGAVAALAEDTVFFTSLSDQEKPSREVSIPAGQLNRYSHESVVALVEKGEETDRVLTIPPPPSRELPSSEEALRFLDSDGNKWVFVPARIPQVIDGRVVGVLPAVDAICLDDSALRKIVPIGRINDTLSTILENISVNQLGGGVVEAVKASFIDG